jgi:hypothetical protein
MKKVEPRRNLRRIDISGVPTDKRHIWTSHIMMKMPENPAFFISTFSIFALAKL